MQPNKIYEDHPNSKNKEAANFIHLVAEDYLYQDQSLKTKPKYNPNNFLMKTKVSNLLKIG